MNFFLESELVDSNKSEVRNLKAETNSKSERISDFISGLRLLLVFALFAGCSVGPNYKRPTVESPAGYRVENQLTNVPYTELAWWEVYRDDNLQALIREALTNNYDLRIAIDRVEQA